MSDIVCQLAKNFSGLVIVGEAPGEEEAKQGLPFVGRAGKLLDKALGEAGISRDNAHVTNVFWHRPPQNNISFFFMNRIKAKAAGIEICTDIPPSNSGLLLEDWRDEYNRLDYELFNRTPKIIVALGATPLWRLTGKTRISAERGLVQEASQLKEAKGLKVIPTWHPAYVLRSQSAYPELVADLMAASKFI
jgi:uracil-DNA glycosylase